MLFFVAILLRSSPVLEAFDLRLDFRVGDSGTFSCEMRFVDDGIFDRRRFGEELRSFRAVVLVCDRRSGALERVGKAGAVAALPPSMLVWEACFCIGAVF
jgi:hypothetical protein